ncbi:hypothetical protein D3Z36_08195 [Lachnospiraceae bacterium]|nr:hypothetical protein [Lachnospiraceae bacterium]
MAVQTKGKCKYCGKEYTKTYMLRHLSACKEKKIPAAGSKKCNYFELAIYGRYDKTYWLIVEICEDALLKDLDSFLRAIWLECCGHLSSFNINGVSYESVPVEGLFWGEPAENMNHKLKTLFTKGMKMDYVYDYGSSTDLIIDVHDYREGERRKEKVTILSRNIPPRILCSECQEKEAVMICMECYWENKGFLCRDCLQTHECEEGMLLAVCNSPRMGVCAYEGSDFYPEEFVPDTKNIKKVLAKSKK